jgi:hypothetical protein
VREAGGRHAEVVQDVVAACNVLDSCKEKEADNVRRLLSRLLTWSSTGAGPDSSVLQIDHAKQRNGRQELRIEDVPHLTLPPPYVSRIL